ncbi:unnamed protein product [Caenorhabditis angaria]|uniref:Hormone-sensitive lipase n=1 Tax=Caenorhabditis angaria TaxID=860376 RepID=A0A9P1IXR1_9PELO|nr:unnamed protein product [Caenorhabditis angaria]
MDIFRDFCQRVRGWQITVEPLMFILAASNTAVSIVSPALKEGKMKRIWTNIIIRKMVEWDNYYEYVNLPIACIFGIIYGGLSDRYGRKYPLLIGIVSVIFSNAMNILIWDQTTDFNLNWTYPTAVLTGFLGDFLLTMSCINAYIADEFPDKITLSYRMVIVSILFSLGSFVSSRFVKHLVKWTSKITVMIIAEGVYLFTFLISALILKQKRPLTKAELLQESEVENLERPTIMQTIKLSFISIYEAALIFTVPREGYRKIFLYLCFFANFLDQFVWGEEKGLLGTYVRLPPFKWDTSTYADYKSWRPIVQIVGMSIGMLFFKRICHFRDTFIIVLAILSMAGCVLMIGLAQASWMIFASLGPGSLHGLLNPMSYTFMACLVEQDEIGKAFAISSIAQKLAGIAQSLILQNIYIQTVDWYQGFVWLLMAVISFLAAGIYLIVHLMAKKKEFSFVSMDVITEEIQAIRIVWSKASRKIMNENSTGSGNAATEKKKLRQRLTGRLSIDRTAIFQLIEQLCSDNAAHFEKSLGANGLYTERMPGVSRKLKESIEVLKENIKKLQEVAPKYDFDEKTPGNGYRSLVCVCDTVLLHVVSLQKAVIEQRCSFVFRLSHFCKELESYATVIDYLNKSIPLCLDIEKNMRGSLFPPLDGCYEKHQEVLKIMERLDSTVFFGRPLGFQFSPSINKIFRVIGIVLATYSLSWEKGHGPIGSLINTGRFFLSPEQRASRIIKVTKEADIDFCKGFWNLSELSNNMPKFFCPNMAVNEIREIALNGPIPMEGEAGDIVMVPEPSAHTGPRPVQYRIFSTVHRQNMSSSPLSTTHPPSKYLVLHCHGGGYVATSSKSHETYLRQWAKSLNCTVVSVEYSLAPENPFPRPTEEVLFAYSWIVNNPAAVGWTGEKIVMVGDSAGGNLIMSMNLRLIDLKIKRKPDGLVLCYTPFVFQYLPSPSRMLSAMDPLLHMGVVLRCVVAYTGGYGVHLNNNNKPKKSSESEDSSDLQQDQLTHRSLQEYVNEVQKTKVDFSGGSQSIVSLVQKSHDNQNYASMKGKSYYSSKKEKDEKPVIETKSDDPSSNSNQEKASNSESENSEEDDDNDAFETTSIASVQVDSDPYHIQLNSTIYDGNLIDYLAQHPITKDAMNRADDEIEDDGENIELDIGKEPPIEQGLEITEHMTIEEEDETDSEIATLPPAPPQDPPKRPRLLHLLSNMTSRDSSSQTAPSTPAQQQVATTSTAKPFTSSSSMNSFPAPIHKRSLSQSLADTAASTAAYAFDNLQEWLERPPKEKQKLERAQSRKENDVEVEGEEAEKEERPSQLFELVTSSNVPRDPLISPIYADDENIRKLPPCYFLACHMDPLLDDTIAFAQKMRNAGGKVESVDILSSVPHGFLNFTLISPECKKSGKVCIQRLKQALGIQDDTNID